MNGRGRAADVIVHSFMVVSLLPQSAGSVGERTGLDANMPDVCIIYQLHLECGRLINLYDWLQVRTCLDDLLTVRRETVVPHGHERQRGDI